MSNDNFSEKDLILQKMIFWLKKELAEVAY